jgi:hypothetical protein
MQSHINTTSQLDLVRQDAAARQARAATYRFVHSQRPARTGRRSLVATLTVAALSLGIVGGAAAQVIDSQPVPQGYEAGLPDGWYDPATDGTVATADDNITPTSTPVRQGYEPGHADGWFNPGEPTVKVAGITLDRTDATVPHNVR